MDDILQSEESQRFFSLISMLQRSAMMHLGMLPDEEGMIHFNQAEAKACVTARALDMGATVATS